MNLHSNLSCELRLSLREEQVKCRLDRELRPDLFQTQFEPERLPETVGTFSESDAQTCDVDPADVASTSIIEMKTLARSDRHVAAFRSGPFHVESAEHKRRTRLKGRFQFPMELQWACAGRFQIDFHEPRSVTVRRSVFFGLRHVKLLTGKRAELRRNANFDSRQLSPFGLNRLHGAQVKSIAIHPQPQFIDDVKNAPRLRLVDRAVPREIELSLHADRFNLSSLRN